MKPLQTGSSRVTVAAQMSVGGSKAKNGRKTFRVILERISIGLPFVGARLSADLKKAWPEWKTRRVTGEINGVAFRTSLFPVKEGGGYLLLVNRQMQKAAKVTFGSEARIWLEPDFEKPSVVMAAEFTAILKGERELRKWFEALSPSMRKGVTQYIDQAKGSEARKRRAEQMAESLMLAMEGEVELPPVLRAAFQRAPAAAEGWAAMSPTQRRYRLMSIFYAQTVAGRERRVEWAVQDCLKVAARRK